MQSTRYSKKFSKRSTGEVVPVRAMKAYIKSRETAPIIFTPALGGGEWSG